jgi:hypothetical protein
MAFTYIGNIRNIPDIPATLATFSLVGSSLGASYSGVDQRINI